MYKKFATRNHGIPGDRNTWARYEGGTLVIKKAKEPVSKYFIAEITEFCRIHGLDFATMHPGERIELPFALPTATPEWQRIKDQLTASVVSIAKSVAAGVADNDVIRAHNNRCARYNVADLIFPLQ